MNIRWLGRLSYKDALAIQEELVSRKASDPSVPDEVFLLEHEPVYTIGRTPDQSSLRSPEALPFEVVQTNRGGQATFHGPGQLIGYPILDLRHTAQDLHRHLRSLEEVIIVALRSFGITGARREGLTGVWVEDRKIASIGVGVRRWITMHGFALNVCGDLTPFSRITPCGIQGVRITSISVEAKRQVSVSSAANAVSDALSSVLHAAPPAASFPA